MSADIIQVQYDELTRVAARFGQQAEYNAQLVVHIQQTMRPLQQGGWLGKGSVAFFSEMNGKVLPALQRLTAALNEARQTTIAIGEIMRGAEEAAATFFKESNGANLPDSQSSGISDPASSNGQTPSRGPSSTDQFATVGLVQFWASLPNLAVTIPNIFAQGWLKVGEGIFWDGPFFGRQLEAWRKELLAITEAPAPWLLPSASDDAVKAFAQSMGRTRLAEVLANSRALQVVGKGLAVLDVSFSLAKLAHNPSFETGLGAGISGLGAWGSFGTSPAALLAGAFAAGYTIGDSFIAPHTTEPLSNALAKWDPLDLGNSAINYPRTTIKDFERHGQVMPIKTAADVFIGLSNEYGPKEARRFAQEYTRSNNISMDKFSNQLPWMNRFVLNGDIGD